MMSPGSPPMTMPRDERSIRDAYDRGRQDLAEQIALGTARGGRSSPVPRLRPHIVQGGRILHDREELRGRRGSFDDDLPPLDRLSLSDEYDSDMRLDHDRQREYHRRVENGSLMSDDPWLDPRRGGGRHDVHHYIEVSDRNPHRYVRRYRD